MGVLVGNPSTGLMPAGRPDATVGLRGCAAVYADGGEAPLGGAEGLVFCVRVGGTRWLRYAPTPTKAPACQFHNVTFRPDSQPTQRTAGWWALLILYLV